MKPILNFEHFSLVENANITFSDDLDNICESFKAAISSPIKYAKIKNNAKKYQKHLVTSALADVEYEKKKQKGLEPKQKEVLTAATAAKKKAMADLATAVSQRMDDLATTEPLKNLVKLARTKAKISAAETSLKSADATETAELKAKLKKLKTTASGTEQKLKDSTKETKSEDKSNDDKASALRKQRKPLIDSASAEKDPAKNAAIRVKIEEINVKIADLEGEGQAEAKEDLANAKERLTKATGGGKKLSAAEDKSKDSANKQLQDQVAGLESKIKDQDNIQKSATENIDKLKKELKVAEDNLNTGKSSESKVNSIKDKISQATEDRDRAKKEEEALRKKLKPIADKLYGE